MAFNGGRVFAQKFWVWNRFFQDSFHATKRILIFNANFEFFNRNVFSNLNDKKNLSFDVFWCSKFAKLSLVTFKLKRSTQSKIAY